MLGPRGGGGGIEEWTKLYSQGSVQQGRSALILFFDDLPLGGEWVTRRRTLTGADIAAYAGLAGDFAPLHTDVEFARRSSLGGLVVPGGLVTAIALGLGSMDAALPATAAMMESNWRYLAPVRPGDTIRARWRLNRKRDIENPRLGLAGWQVSVENQNGLVVAVGDVVRLIERAQAEIEPVPAEALERAPRRRRRGGRRTGEREENAGPEAAADAVAAPEPAESAPAGGPELEPGADVPAPPARRRRRRGGRGRGGLDAGEAGAASASPADQPMPVPEPESAPPAAIPAARRRTPRRPPADASPAAPLASPAALDIPTTAPVASLPRPRTRRATAAAETDGAPDDPHRSGRSLGGVLRRLRGGS
ncbi:MAG TPA: MaoC/PaaZ C-terminal domain-containing protein [Candidatus Nitrosotalea sp.]|nr:MaoC/PaaZ C-terminal domain-containing protein [Candidatus Nitrosotalea sp.]